MNKIIEVCGENFLDANLAVIKNLNPTDFAKKNIVFVPNGAEEYAEKLIFASLRTPVFFGTKICTISKFVEETLGQQPLSKFQQKIVLRKAVQSLSKNLTLFNGQITSGLIGQIFEEILRFEDADLLPQDLKDLKISDKFLQNKVSDLKQIYDRYLSLLGENFDDFKLKQKFFESELFFENYNFFFLNKNFFSKIEEKIIEKLSLSANKVFVASVSPKNQGNSYVFESVFQNKYETVFAPKKLPIKADKISKLAFSVDDQKEELDFLRVIEAENPHSEIFAVLSQIKKLLYEKRCTQKDITILCGNLSMYREELVRALGEFGFDFCIKNSRNLQDFAVSKFVLNVLKFLENKSAQTFQNILFSEFSEIQESERNFLFDYIQTLGPLSESAYNNLPETIQASIKELNLKLLDIQNQKLFSTRLEKIIKIFNLEQQILGLSQNLIVANFSEEANKNISALQKLVQFVEDTSIFEDNLQNNELLEIFENFLAETEVGVSDFDGAGIKILSAEEYIFPSKYLFVMGVNQGAVPSTKNDTNVLTDLNLKTLNLGALPVVKQNRLTRLRVLENLICFEEMLFLSYSLTDFSGQKLLASAFVKSLCDVAKNDVLVNVSQKFFEDAENLPLETKSFLFAQMLGTMQNAKKSYINLEKDCESEFYDLLPSLEKVVGETKYAEQEKSLDIDKKLLFFPENKTKVSQIETYYACPFRHFLAYGLKLMENQKPKFMAVDTGNLLHKIAEEFLSDKNVYKTQIDTFKCVEEIFDGLKNQKNFEKIFYKENEISFEILKQEAVRLCEFLKSTQTKSNYKPKFLEVYFGKTQKFTLSVRGEDFSLVGIVDRVDVLNDGAVVIDYKTSTHAKGTNQELFYGEKIQIFVYAKALENLFNLKTQGVFYFPIVNKFFEEGKEKLYMLAGKNMKDVDFLSNFDTTLTYDNPKSKIFPCAIKTSKEVRQQGIVEYSLSSGHEERKHFEAMINYAVKLVENAIGEILDGSFAVSPKKGACSFCPYLSICQKNKVTKERFLDFEVESGTFMACLDEGGENSGKDTI